MDDFDKYLQDRLKRDKKLAYVHNKLLNMGYTSKDFPSDLIYKLGDEFDDYINYNHQLLEDYFEPLKAYNFLPGNGSKIIEETLEKQSVKVEAKVYRDIYLLEQGAKFSKDSFDYFPDIDFFELRVRFSNVQVRLLFFKETYKGERRAIITNCFLKKTGRTPQSEKELAKNRRNIYKKEHKVERSIPDGYRKS